MRPLQFLCLLAFFIALPLLLTCLSLFSGSQVDARPIGAGIQTRTSRFRALFSFSTPSSLFPPSAVISLTNDNSTFFLARPAAFGPTLPSHGLTGQLWVGKGFGDEAMLSEEELKGSGFELGCSDVPGWSDEHRRRPENGITDLKSSKVVGTEMSSKPLTPPKSKLPKRDEVPEDDSEPTTTDDGTDDHLHRPLADSNPASSAEPGEPANANAQDKSRPPTHADIESLQESADIAGKIVMLSRGGCGFLEKVKWAQRRGGIALVVGDNERSGSLTIMYAKGDTSNVTIPAVLTSYNAAHLLSSLVPPEHDDNDGGEHNDPTVPPKGDKRGGKNSGGKGHGAVFTSTRNHKSQETVIGGHPSNNNGLMQNVLSAVGLVDSTNSPADDSRRPPSSGNIDWILLEDWDEELSVSTSTQSATQTTLVEKETGTTVRKGKAHATSTRRSGNDDFVIGVQDWRDTEVIAPKPRTTQGSNKKNGKAGEKAAHEKSATTTSIAPAETTLKGGSITPGSGEYDHQKQNSKGRSRHKEGGSESNRLDKHATHREKGSFRERIASVFRSTEEEPLHPRPDDHDKPRSATSGQGTLAREKPRHPPHDHGLWVTITPTSVSASPFFDTLLVLVVSPLITLSIVYGLLLFRSRMRRRRWRAPKSIVERLPVRTYHTMTSTSSTTSSQLSSPNLSTNTSPQLRPTSTRPRPRSQTTIGVVNSPPTPEKNASKQGGKRKPYSGRQIECVVCLEEYVDGESRVMSLPCGHEFHAECITPWLVTRRRTCPICKGDVVRSFARGSASNATSTPEDERQEHEETSDDIQDRAAETVNNEGSAAIPIPSPDGNVPDEDIERGEAIDAPLLGRTRSSRNGNGWRGLLGGSVSRLSGETVWRSSPNDRTR